MMHLDREKLDLAMARKCYNITDLIQKAGVSYASVIKINSGTMKLTTKTLGKLAKALDVDPKELIKDE